MHARHFGFSTIVIAQQFTSIAKLFRENISKLVIFYNPSKKDMQTITEEFLNVEKEEIKDIVQKLKNNKHSTLEILLRHPFTHEVTLQINERYTSKLMLIVGIAILIPALVIMLVAVLLIVIADELLTREIIYIIYNKWKTK